jgi:ketosteroid isomerase-like protein
MLLPTRDTVLAYIRAIEAMDLDAVDAFLHPDLETIEHPNQLNPVGKRYDRTAMRAAGERGKAVMASQRYEVRAITVEDDRATVQMAWTGVLTSGTEMRAEICSCIELRDGKVWRQEQYDCFR